MQKKKGISLIVLVITIIVMIILASAVVISLNNNGIIGRTSEAKKRIQISEEKEMITVALNLSKINSGAYKQMVITNLNNSFGNGEVEVGFVAKDINIYIKTTEHCFRIKNGADIEYIGDNMYIKDDTPGVLQTETRKDAENQDITVYKIESVEDLITWTKNANTYKTSDIVLTKDLDLSSMFSYVDHTTKTYGDINEDGVIDELATELNTKSGFLPVSSYKGVFDGEYHTIYNIYENRTNAYGLVVDGNCTIKRLSITGEITGERNATGFVGGQSANVIECINYAKITGGGGVSGIAGGIFQNVNNFFVLFLNII